MIWIIMPVYNTAAYLEEAIESVISQDCSFEENIILYLIDDASTDNSLQICKRYQKRYPSNVRVTHFECNRGVSEARNYAVGKCIGEQKNDSEIMVGFIDSDDRIGVSYVSEAMRYMKSHPDINVAATWVEYFGALQEEYRLNYRFDGRDVVDIHRNFNCPQYYIGGVFLRGSALESIHFEEGMAFWEDALAINKVILQEGKYGLIRNACYYYRKREDRSSLADRAWNTYKEYESIIKNGYLPLIRYSISHRLRVVPYIQFVVGYHLRRFMNPERSRMIGEVMTENEKRRFLKNLRFVLRFIRCSVITKIPTTLPIIEEMLTVKKGKRIRIPRTYKKNDCVYIHRGYEVARISERRVRLFYKVGEEPEEDKRDITPAEQQRREIFRGMWRGRFATPVYEMKKDDYIFAEHNGCRVRSYRYPCHKRVQIFDDVLRNYRYAGFVIPIPDEWDRARFGICMEGHEIFLNEIVFSEIIPWMPGNGANPNVRGDNSVESGTMESIE